MNRESSDKTLELPNDSLINEVITSVIIFDSLDSAKLGQRKLLIPFIYFMPKWDRKSHDPPPPPPIPTHPYNLKYGHTYDELFSYFNSLNDLKQRQKDSIFALRQIDTTISHNVSNKASLLFRGEKDDYYWFSLPIFSTDKKTVVISYSEENYFGYCTVLRKIDDKWVKVDHKMTWMR